MRLSLSTLLAAATLALVATNLTAQSDYSLRKATSKFSIGAGFGLGVTFPTGPLDSNLENTPGLSYRFGLNARYPISRMFSALLGIGGDFRQVGKKVSGQSSGQNYNFTYLFVEPGVEIRSFRASLNIGIPGGVKAPNPLDPNGDQIDPGSDVQEMLLEPRIGGTLVIMENERSWLGLNIDGGIALNTFYKKDAAAFRENDTPAAHSINLMLGATYQFGL